MGGACSNQEHDNKRVEILIVKLKKNRLYGDLDNMENYLGLKKFWM